MHVKSVKKTSCLNLKQARAGLEGVCVGAQIRWNVESPARGTTPRPSQVRLMRKKTSSQKHFLVFAPFPFAFPLNASGTLHLHEYTSQLFGLLHFPPVTGCLLHDLVYCLDILLCVQTRTVSSSSPILRILPKVLGHSMSFVS
jgi:hypothetical protein